MTMIKKTQPLKEIIMQKTEQWHQNHGIFIIEHGVLVSKPQPNDFDKSPIFKILMEAVKDWLEQNQQYYDDTKGEFWSLQVSLEYKKLLKELLS